MTDTVRRFRRHSAGEESADDLLPECGQKLTDRALWAKFQDRFQGLIFLYLLRALRFRSIQEDVTEIVPDLAQDVYMKLVQHDGRVLRSFRGETEFSAMAFLAKISASVVQDYHRHRGREKRRGQNRRVHPRTRFQPRAEQLLAHLVVLQRCERRASLYRRPLLPP